MSSASQELTSSLEDYLETVYQLVRDHKLARVKEIAKARGVRSASVTPAMHRLADLGLIRYHQREYIDLTPEGAQVARKIYAKHQLLTRLLVEVLGMSTEQAKTDACAMEHSLSAEGMDRVVKFFEYLQVCPGSGDMLKRFHRCSLVNAGNPPCGLDCSHRRQDCNSEPLRALSALKPGERGSVAQITEGKSAIRQRLLDMGIIPEAIVEVQRIAPAGDPIWITLGGFQLSLRRSEAESVLMREAGAASEGNSDTP
jgi:DtxR family Mn-dependent transcriptional regulator